MWQWLKKCLISLEWLSIRDQRWHTNSSNNILVSYHASSLSLESYHASSLSHTSDTSKSVHFSGTTVVRYNRRRERLMTTLVWPMAWTLMGKKEVKPSEWGMHKDLCVTLQVGTLVTLYITAISESCQSQHWRALCHAACQRWMQQWQQQWIGLTVSIKKNHWRLTANHQLTTV